MDDEIAKHIKDAWVCLRINNSSIPDHLLDEFRQVLENHYIKSEDPK